MKPDLKNSWTLGGLSHDFFVLIALFCFLTGYIPFIPETFYQTAAQKPWIHRLALTLFTASGSLWFLLRQLRIQKNELRQTPLVTFVAELKIPASACVAGLFIFTSALWSYASIARHQAFQSGFDMAIFTQAVRNTANGAFLYSSIKGGICLLGDHFSPILAVFALPYRLWPNPECLLVLQAVLAASSVFPLYLLAKNKTGKIWALAVLFTFVCYLPMRNSVRFEFHPEVAALPLFFWAYYFWDRKRLVLTSLFLGLVLLSKESAAIVTFGFGFYALLKRRIIFGILWMAVSAIYFYFAVRIWIPQLSGQEYFYLSGNFLAWKETGLGTFLKQMFSPSSLIYIVKIFLPVGFLPFGNLSAVLTLPGLLQNLTSRNEMTRSIFFQYTAILTPFVFISMTETLGKFFPKKKGLVIHMVFCAILMAGVSDFYVARRCDKQRTAHLREIPQYFSLIPPEASVRTHEFFAAHLANRREVHIFENHHPREGGSEKALTSEYIVVDHFFLHGEELDDVRLNYALTFEKNGFMIFKRNPSPRS